MSKPCAATLVLSATDVLACSTRVEHDWHTFIDADRDDWLYLWDNLGLIVERGTARDWTYA